MMSLIKTHLLELERLKEKHEQHDLTLLDIACFNSLSPTRQLDSLLKPFLNR